MRYMLAKNLVIVTYVALILFITSAEVRAQTTPAPSPTPAGWRLNVTPYLWLPTMNGSFHFQRADILSHALPSFELPTGATVVIGPNSYLSHLNSALMFTAEVRKGSGGFFTDLIYMNLSSGTSSVKSLEGPNGNVVIPINVSTSARLTATLWTIGIAGSPVETPENTRFDVLGAFRNINITANAAWSLRGPLGLIDPNGIAKKTTTETIPVFGIKGRLSLGQHFFFPYYGDYGASGALSSWQYVAGFGYGYHSGAALLVWRQLGFAATGSNSAALIQNLQMGGPAFGWTFNL